MLDQGSPSHPAQGQPSASVAAGAAMTPWAAPASEGGGQPCWQRRLIPALRASSRRHVRTESAPIRRTVPARSANGCHTASIQLGSIAGTVARRGTGDKELRDSLRQFLERFHLPENVEFDLLVATGEVITNAIRYGQGEQVHWKSLITRKRAIVEIDYASQWFNTVPVSPAGTSQEGGRGIILMRALMDEVDFDFVEGQVHICLVKNLGG